MSKYVSLGNLARYDGRLQTYASGVCAPHSQANAHANWRQTEKAGAVAFWPVGNSPLEGTVEFIFKETGPASGTKSPDNPSTISGVSSIGLTVCQEEGVDEHEYTLSLGSTYYGGSIDLATGLMTVTKEHITVSSVAASDGIQNGTAVCRFWTGSKYQAVVSDDTETCNNLPYARTGTGIDRFYIGTSANSSGQYPIYIILQTSYLDFSGATDPANPTNTEVRLAVNSYLASNNLHIVATLKEPATVQLTPTQIRSLPALDKYEPRINTVYTDAENVQIVYQKNPVRDKFEKVQAIIAQGGNV